MSKRAPRKPTPLEETWGFVQAVGTNECRFCVWYTLSLQEMKILKAKIDSYIAWAEYRRKAPKANRRKPRGTK